MIQKIGTYNFEHVKLPPDIDIGDKHHESRVIKCHALHLSHMFHVSCMLAFSVQCTGDL